MRRRIAAGTVYQVNLCRVLEHHLPDDATARRTSGPGWPARQPGPLRRDHRPARGGARDRLRVAGGLPRAPRSAGDVAADQGHGADGRAELLPKDYAENVMIVDLVRHDLGHVSLPGTVEVDHLCRVEEHPGLVHLVSDVSGTLAARHDLA